MEIRRKIKKALRLGRHVALSYRHNRTGQLFACGGKIGYCGGLSFEIMAGPGLKKEIDYSWVESLTTFRRKRTPVYYFDPLE